MFTADTTPEALMAYMLLPERATQNCEVSFALPS